MQKTRGVTDSNITLINKAIADYYYEFGNYPCPADPTRNPTHSNHGVANCALPSFDGNRHVGSVPFVTLKIPMQMALDGWSNKITYTVANALVQPGPFTTNPTTNLQLNRFVLFGEPAGSPPGTPSVDCPGTDVTDNNIHFVLVSHGPSGVGAFSARGTQVRACQSGVGDPRDGENCDNDVEFFGDSCARNDVQGENFYDDIVYADSTLPSRMWVYSTATAPAPDPSDIVSTVGQVGINNQAPFANTPSPAQVGVDVAGNVLAGDGSVNTGTIMATFLCDENGAHCFDPRLIVKTADMMNDCTKTSGSTYMRGIWAGEEILDNRSGARVRCQNSYLPSASNLCAPKYAIGFSGGRILCAP